MTVKVRISFPLRKFTNGQKIVEVRGQTPRDCLRHLQARFPSIGRWLYEKPGQLRPHVCLFINGERIYEDELALPLVDGDELFILISIAGG
jgi:molybdopterin synthase sulfur carrier subunit